MRVANNYYKTYAELVQNLKSQIDGEGFERPEVCDGSR